MLSLEKNKPARHSKTSLHGCRLKTISSPQVFARKLVRGRMPQARTLSRAFNDFINALEPSKTSPAIRGSALAPLLRNGFAAATIGRSTFFSARAFPETRRHGCCLKAISLPQVFARKLVSDRGRKHVMLNFVSASVSNIAHGFRNNFGMTCFYQIHRK